MAEFIFPLVGFGGVIKGTKSAERFSGVNEGDIVSGGGDVLRVAYTATTKYLV